jgi:hypothetical protein
VLVCPPPAAVPPPVPANAPPGPVPPLYAQSGPLTTLWDGPRPPNGYAPKKLQRAIIIGTGSDGGPGGTGTYFEGCMTSGVSSDEIDEAIQANIVAAGYGR